MTTFFMVCISILITVNGFPSNQRKIKFSPDKKIDYSKIHFNENVQEVGSLEYYESHRVIAVSSDGTEYTGSLEEVMTRMKLAAAEDFEFPSDPNPGIKGQFPSDPNPNAKAMGPDDPEDPDVPNTEQQKKPAMYDILSQALDSHKTMAEKRSVIGTDERFKITNPTTRLPYTASGKIDIGCTGTFVAPRAVLTAGHCVHQGNGGSWYENLNFQRQKNCDPDTGISHIWKYAITFTGWTQNSYVAYDIAIITYHQSSPAIMPFTSSSVIRLETINIAGYPGDKPGWCMWASYCKLAEVTSTQLKYPCDTAGGMSGSGVYKYWSPSTRIIYGVHAYGAGSSNLNKATRITAAFESQIKYCIIPVYGGN